MVVVAVGAAVVSCEHNLNSGNKMHVVHVVGMILMHRRYCRIEEVVPRLEMSLVHIYFVATTLLRPVRKLVTKNCLDEQAGMTAWTDRGAHCHKQDWR